MRKNLNAQNYEYTKNQNAPNERRIQKPKSLFCFVERQQRGKADEQPLSKLLVVSTNNVAEREYFYWLCYGLWAGGFFCPFLSGSVISFLRISELQEVIYQAHSKIDLRREALMNSIEILNKLSAHQDVLLKQVQLIKQAKKALIYKILK